MKKFPLAKDETIVALIKITYRIRLNASIHKDAKEEAHVLPVKAVETPAHHLTTEKTKNQTFKNFHPVFLLE